VDLEQVASFCASDKGFLLAGCHGNLTVFNLLSASVTKKSAFSPLQEKLRWIKK